MTSIILIGDLCSISQNEKKVEIKKIDKKIPNVLRFSLFSQENSFSAFVSLPGFMCAKQLLRNIIRQCVSYLQDVELRDECINYYSKKISSTNV